MSSPDFLVSVDVWGLRRKMRGIVKKLEQELYGTVVTVQSPGSRDQVTFVVTQYDDPVELGDEIYWDVDRSPKNREALSEYDRSLVSPVCQEALKAGVPFDIIGDIPDQESWDCPEHGSLCDGDECCCKDLHHD